MSLAGAIDSATAKILRDLAAVTGAADMLKGAAGAAGAALAKAAESMDNIRRIVAQQIAEGIHTPLGATIDPVTGQPLDPFTPFEIGPAHGAPSSPSGFDELGFAEDGLFQIMQELQPTEVGPAAEQAGVSYPAPPSYNDTSTGAAMSQQDQLNQSTGQGTGYIPGPSGSSTGSTSTSQQDFPIDNEGGG